MHILLTGVTGYIGQRMLPNLLEQGHQVTCLVRDQRRLILPETHSEQIRVIEGDLTKPETLNFPKDIDAAYYLVHSLKRKSEEFSDMEAQCARNFSAAIDQTKCQQVVFLSGIANDPNLSPHLSSRLHVESILQQGSVPVTVLRAAVIIGSGSASFEIIRDLVEKLPVMVAPKWLNSRIQPIAIRNVIEYLTDVLGKSKSCGKVFDIGGNDILTYREMLLQYAQVRGLKRLIITLPVLTPRLSSYWLYFVTSVNFNLASNLVDSLKNDVVVARTGIRDIVDTKLLGYKESVQRAFQRIEQNLVLSSWKDAPSTGVIPSDFADYVQVPKNGCFIDQQSVVISNDKADTVKDHLWRIGGNQGWYFMNWAWQIRGLMDKMVGGVGLRRGRRNATELRPYDALDFWRVLVADREKGRLLLLAEMKVPGEAWLEFTFQKNGEQTIINQTATFRPKGIRGRVYWYLLWIPHKLIFKGMLQKIVATHKN